MEVQEPRLFEVRGPEDLAALESGADVPASAHLLIRANLHRSPFKAVENALNATDVTLRYLEGRPS